MQAKLGQAGGSGNFGEEKLMKRGPEINLSCPSSSSSSRTVTVVVVVVAAVVVVAIFRTQSLCSNCM